MSLITDAQVAQFRELGYFVTAPMFSEAELAPVREEFDRLHRERIAEAEQGQDAKAIELARYRPFIGQAHTRSAVLHRLVRAPIYLEACARFIGPDADLYYNQVVIKPPEKGQSFAWHQDSGYVLTNPLAYITCWTAISATTLENGCIWVIPKSHTWGLQEHRHDEVTRQLYVDCPETDAIAVPMAAGQVAIFSSLTLHKSGPNTSGTVRRGYVPQYHVPNVISVKSGKPWGDLHPVLRGGRPVEA